MTEITEKVLELLDRYQVQLKQVQRAELISVTDELVNALSKKSWEEGYEDGKHTAWGYYI